MILVRHGENEVNVDVSVTRYSEAGLTSRGQEEARLLARSWTDRPPIASTSPFKSARQTARLLRVRGQAEPRVEPLLAEFRYLDPAFADGSTRAERRERSRAFWDRCDPLYRDGVGAESFADLWDRVGALFSSVAGPPGPEPLVMVTHGMLIAAAQLFARHSDASLPQLMRCFSDGLHRGGVVPNCGVVRVRTCTEPATDES